MLKLLALIFMLIVLIKVVSFMVFPDETIDFTEQTYAHIEKYGMILQGAVIALAIIVGALLSMMIGFYTMIVAGWFWSLFYSTFLIPLVLESIKNQRFKASLLSDELKHQLMVSCIFVVCLCVLTIALLI
ncbi:MAG: hypothetical protein CMF43_03635 [Legionellales bacterium]|jgi:hypothetical protein|nr:hypothetical protein [Legionellales bacterium]|tara:strand:+ start:863 stop:1252 length:390 start_codon:yes stop_codon:yes gene_type:complete